MPKGTYIFGILLLLGIFFSFVHGLFLPTIPIDQL